mmetsp:Transcript_71753/g.83421  ORF Transcript_71753/g.83421 Transcript_71753/m.83421 type:complete len:351 (-) Transcript_71753:181-1233(-)|eukprot:CAMPEP_0176441070 /NCGR_PEP_ID=MMETSP0127-20121128/20967_1 /TAXON_ID=938130 /ORGANISM="Platyophrya macrostoma, Strain WH" /LENGTH=350 /DNA_ID=CAMNT_0017825755 /DNA_START=78 /DNA_END=1133 /DNA_ORIENTATION=-
MQSQITQVKAIGLIKPGGSKDLKVLHYNRKPLGPRDLLVKIHAVSVNPVDFKKRKSGFAEPEPNSEENPIIMGYDASGVVIEVGSDVKFYKVGDEVFYLGDITRKGTNGPEHVVDERIVGPKPKSLTHAQAAAIPLVFATALEGLTAQLRISEDPEKNKGKTILVVAGAGGMGSAVIQLAKKIFGFTVIATASREDTIEYSKKMGADIVINHRNPLAEELKKHGFDGVNYIFNCYDVTLEYFQQFAKIILPFGGILGITGFKEPLNLAPLFGKNAFAATEYVFSRSTYGTGIDLQRDDLIKISKWLDEGKIEHNMTIQEDFNLENLIKAHDKLESGTMIGKYVLDNVDKF